jgi:hypothetical protein
LSKAKPEVVYDDEEIDNNITDNTYNAGMFDYNELKPPKIEKNWIDGQNFYSPQGASKEAQEILKEEIGYFRGLEGTEYVVKLIGMVLFVV